MKIKDVLQRDPRANPLVNEGQARISDDRSDRIDSESRGELAMFVCEGEYADGIVKIVRSFLDNQGRTSQRGAWVSGFYGSGKSHLLKMLCHLWQDTVFSDGATARSIVPSIPEDLRTLLRELDTAGRRAGGLLAAAGAMPSGTTENVRLTILALLLRAVGLPAQYPQARFCLWLHSTGQFEGVKAAVEADGKSFERELNNLYVSPSIARALIASDANFAPTEAEAKQLLKAQFPFQASDISTEEFLRTVKDGLGLVGKDGRLPCTLLVLDEVQNYIGQSNDRSVLVTEVAEAVSKQLDSQVMIVGAGQSALTDVPLLTKLMDRFTIRVSLTDADMETVTRKVLLQKRPSEIAVVRNLLDEHAGEISRQLQGTGIGETGADRSTIVDDYPLLPVRWRFWEHCFRQIDPTGTRSQLRSQLRITYDALVNIAEKPLGNVVPADELFSQQASEMVTSGVLLRELNERIIQVGETEGDLAKRVCGLVFLIGKLPREQGSDIGVRATKDIVADLLIEDLGADNGKLRTEVDVMLKKLAQQGALMLLGDEYRLQTREGSEWDREFRNRQSKLNGDDAAISFKRDQLLYGELEKTMRAIKTLQGSAKEPRQFMLHRGDSPPAVDGTTVPIWIRDAWSSTEKEVLDAARSAGTENPTVFLFVPRKSDDELRRLIVESDAAQQTLDAKGSPATAEGMEARQSMDSRRVRAVAERDGLARQIIANTKVYQGGGSEIMSSELDERIRRSTEAALVRLFPRFKEADSAAWETVIKRARDGADHPFQPVGHSDATEKHAVCQQVLSTIGSGKSGTEVRKALGSAPFGWPRDAVDAALIALHRLQHITATLNGQTIAPGQLDQSKIAKAEFRVEHVTLSVEDRLVLRKLFFAMGLQCKSGEENEFAGKFLAELVNLAKEASGDAPLPAQPDLTEIEDVQRLVGNEQLVAMKNNAENWEKKIATWNKTRNLIAQRLPTWALVERLVKHAEPLAEFAPYLKQVAAIRDQRLLLDASDPVNAIRVDLATLLRETLQSELLLYNAAFSAAIDALAKNEIWVKLSGTDQTSIKATVGLTAPAKPSVAGDDALADYLDRTPLSTVRAEIAAISGRREDAIEHAARLLEPKVQTVTLERTTLRDPSEVDTWVERQRIRLIDAVRQGPVLVN